MKTRVRVRATGGKDISGRASSRNISREQTSLAAGPCSVSPIVGRGRSERGVSMITSLFAFKRLKDDCDEDGREHEGAETRERGRLRPKDKTCEEDLLGFI